MAERESGRKIIANLAEKGCYYLTVQDFSELRGISLIASRAALRRLARQGELAMPCRGFYVIVPPEYRKLGCLPGEQLVPLLMDHHFKQSYYTALLSAAQLHGAAHQSPHKFQVMLRRNRRPINCGKVSVEFFAKDMFSENGTTKFNTRRGYIEVSCPEVTAIDLIGHQKQCGGMSHVATVISELSENISPENLVSHARSAPLAWIQRLGYVLKICEETELFQALKTFLKDQPTQLKPLIPGIKTSGSNKDDDFLLTINSQIEIDT